MSKGITKRKESFSKWYTDIIAKADLAEHSAVRGCMVIKPYGFGIWEKIQSILDNMFKETGHTNAYFPLFIPKSFLSKEADHVEGFAKECAVVTHYRLKNDENGKGLIVDPEAKLDEELIVRPTSETIIWNSYRNWIQSYRDLPLLINQWANVVRWEMRPRLFLRTAEFLWQEGHTAHATRDEAIEEAETMLKVYTDFAENYMAMPVIQGTKTENEKFAGAIETYCIEAMMQDGKALQAGTSHFLGQNFAKAFDVKFSNKEGVLEHVWATSWGVSTRLMGALIMTHSDDSGLILPPKLAPVQVVIVPIYKGDEELDKIRKVATEIISDLKSIGVRIIFDDDDTKKPGWKFAEHELKGVPLRIALGPRDLKNNTVEVSRRDILQKETIPQSDLNKYIPEQLNKIQDNLFERAKTFRDNNTHHANSYDEFKELLESKGGFIYAHWDGTSETELKIKEETKASIRAIPFDGDPDTGHCIYTGKPSKRKVIFAKAY
ncbi:MAG TPA: proline--tRNA ligase [Bacteroidetes bacterium]|nr:proline--tRNA ligase [Bacteroidota bacterium]